MRICDDIERACTDFRWIDSDKGKSMHWKKWDDLCKLKCKGVLVSRKWRHLIKLLLVSKFGECLMLQILWWLEF